MSGLGHFQEQTCSSRQEASAHAPLTEACPAGNEDSLAVLPGGYVVGAGRVQPRGWLQGFPGASSSLLGWPTSEPLPQPAPGQPRLASRGPSASGLATRHPRAALAQPGPIPGAVEAGKPRSAAGPGVWRAHGSRSTREGLACDAEGRPRPPWARVTGPGARHSATRAAGRGLPPPRSSHQRTDFRERQFRPDVSEALPVKLGHLATRSRT